LRHIHTFEKVYVEVYVDSWPVCKPGQALPITLGFARNGLTLIVQRLSSSQSRPCRAALILACMALPSSRLCTEP
jgi:hypothetical protein